MTPRTEFRFVDPSVAKDALPPCSIGEKPDLRWIKITDLVIDSTYQRDIRGDGASRIRRIANNFSWSKFAPVVVAPVGEGGWYCIIDGQHRVTAAAAIGIESVPCQVIYVDTEGAAAAFAAINGEVTQVTSLEKYWARLRAAEPAAIALKRVLEITNVELCKYPIPSWDMKPGQTLALWALESGIKLGRDTLITALQCITETENNVAGILRAPVIRSLCLVLHAAPEWREAGGRLMDAMDNIDLYSLYERAASSRIGATKDELMSLLRVSLVRELGPPVAIGKAG